MPRLPKHDPLDVPASREEINQWRREQEQAPIKVGDFLFDADRDSIDRMERACTYWDAECIAWTMADNTEHEFAFVAFSQTVSKVVQGKALRSASLHRAAQDFKRNGATHRQLKDWKP